VDGGAVRPAALPDLLRDVHREGLGVPAGEIQADWAAQRIKDLSLAKAAIHALFPVAEKNTVTS